MYKSIGLVVLLASSQTACVSKGPLKNNAGALYEFSDDQPSNLEIDINRILFNQICLNTEETPPECFAIEGGLNPFETTVGKEQRVENGKTLTFKTRNTDGKQVFSNLLLALERLPSARQKEVRNAAADQMIAGSEHGCRNYMFTLRGVQSNTRFGTDIFSGLAASAASLTEAADPSKLYSALSAFGIMTSATVDRSYFANQAIEPVRKAIDDRRSRLRTEIQTNLAKPYDQYSFGIAMSDLIRFHSACSLMEGLNLVSNAVDTRETSVQGSRLVAQRLQESGASATQIVQALTGLEEAHFGLSSDNTLQNALTGRGVEADLSKARLTVSESLKELGIVGAGSFDAVKTAILSHCTDQQAGAQCLLVSSFSQEWWEKTKSTLPDADEEGNKKYSEDLYSAIDDNLSAAAGKVAAKRQVIVSILQQSQKSKSLSFKDLNDLGAGALFSDDDQADPVIALARQAFQMSKDLSDETSAQQTAIMALSFIDAYLNSQ